MKVQRHRQRGSVDAQPVQARKVRPSRPKQKLKPPLKPLPKSPHKLKQSKSRSQLLSLKSLSTTMLLIWKIFN